ncbi:hypothetical protein [Azospirillum palustre]
MHKAPKPGTIPSPPRGEGQGEGDAWRPVTGGRAVIRQELKLERRFTARCVPLRIPLPRPSPGWERG